MYSLVYCQDRFHNEKTVTGDITLNSNMAIGFKIITYIKLFITICDYKVCSTGSYDKQFNLNSRGGCFPLTREQTLKNAVALLKIQNYIRVVSPL